MAACRRPPATAAPQRPRPRPAAAQRPHARPAAATLRACSQHRSRSRRRSRPGPRRLRRRRRRRDVNADAAAAVGVRSAAGARSSDQVKGYSALPSIAIEESDRDAPQVVCVPNSLALLAGALDGACIAQRPPWWMYWRRREEGGREKGGKREGIVVVGVGVAVLPPPSLKAPTPAVLESLRARCANPPFKAPPPVLRAAVP